MDEAEKQELMRDLEMYKDKLRECKTLLIELEALITLDTYRRDRL